MLSRSKVHEANTMATEVSLDDELLEKARKLGKYRTKKAAAAAALKEFVSRREERLKILDLFGTVDFDPTYDYKRERSRKK